MNYAGVYDTTNISSWFNGQKRATVAIAVFKLIQVSSFCFQLVSITRVVPYVRKVCSTGGGDVKLSRVPTRGGGGRF